MNGGFVPSPKTALRTPQILPSHQLRECPFCGYRHPLFATGRRGTLELRSAALRPPPEPADLAGCEQTQSRRNGSQHAAPNTEIQLPGHCPSKKLRVVVTEKISRIDSSRLTELAQYRFRAVEMPEPLSSLPRPRNSSCCSRPLRVQATVGSRPSDDTANGGCTPVWRIQCPFELAACVF